MLNEALAIDSALEDSDASYQLISDIEAIMPGELPGLHNHHVTNVLRSRVYYRCLALDGRPGPGLPIRAAGQFVQLGGLTGVEAPTPNTPALCSDAKSESSSRPSLAAAAQAPRAAHHCRRET